MWETRQTKDREEEAEEEEEEAGVFIEQVRSGVCVHVT